MSEERAATMTGAYLPGGRRVELRVHEPGHGQVPVAMKASSICGSDLRAIYRERLGEGPEAYQGEVAGHEPSGRIAAVGPGCRRFGVGERVVVYHIKGCGMCRDCREGYMVSCPSRHRAAYGWQRDGGHAPCMLAEESVCIPLHDDLSYVDGALVSCGFGTAHEAIVADGNAVACIRGLTGGSGCDVSLDCSGAGAGRALAVRVVRRWGRLMLIGEGPALDAVDVSRDAIHMQLTIMGSWVTNLARMEELVERLAAWRLHPEHTVTHRYDLEDAGEAYAQADRGTTGKVCIVMGGAT